ncbi:SIS domain-containing protein [Streptomyces sp. 110]|uniref:Glutamine--fructose-6-phosphate aminotransferase [isomerizing] n=1 Tax=Streptomyces endocoffeicus TaxID=2898945 RepID=A0ABS1PRC7_9ACTN|nr:SIS domain-containing protein [Streptomyces endocoffeicus]MBL1114979.1 SIS domain-containing protein [Streptomyces endocoffeicus]
MGALDPEVMIRQVSCLAGDLKDMTGPVGRVVEALFASADWGSVGSVHLVGDGDSYYAALSAELAFRSLAGVDCVAAPALGFLEYQAPWLRPRNTGRHLVVGISASGFTPRVVQALARAGRHGALTLALTGVPDSPLARTADHTLPVQLSGSEPSPGIRTYQASLLGLLLLAVRLGEARRHHTSGGREALEREIATMHEGVASTVAELGEACSRAARLVGDGPVVVMVGSGPGLGAALYGAAKLIEGAGVSARGQDLEEWHHVDRFAGPYDMPVFVLAPPGRSHRRAVEVAARAAELGRRVIAVAHREDTAVVSHSTAVLPVAARPREEFSPLLYHLFSGVLACRTAQRLGRVPFCTGPAAPATASLAVAQRSSPVSTGLV